MLESYSPVDPKIPFELPPSDPNTDAPATPPSPGISPNLPATPLFPDDNPDLPGQPEPDPELPDDREMGA